MKRATMALVLLLVTVPVLAVDGEPEYPHGEFEGECSQCHKDEGWRPARVSSDYRHTSRFPLKGVHNQVQCVACHESLRFQEAVGDCVACHTDVHRGELGSDCSRCHTERNFIDRTGMINSHQATRFPLRGAHRALDCEDCHSLTPEDRMQYVNREAVCEACHLELYAGTVSPDHTALGFPTDCASCHNAVVWDLTPGSFDHGPFAATPCVTCHLNDYNGANDPDHVGFDFSQDCTECHSSTRTWDGALFDHNLVPGVPCESCHLDDYDRTTDPNHRSANFPIDCTECHSSTTTWDGAVFDHDGLFFPIYSGVHNNRWDTCSDCHINPASFSEFSCIDCHEHNDPQEVAGDHDSVSEYVPSSFDSNECFRCHPQGRAEE